MPCQFHARLRGRRQRLSGQQPVNSVTPPRRPNRAISAEYDVTFVIPGDNIAEDPVEDLSVDDENRQYLTSERQRVQPCAQVPHPDLAIPAGLVETGERLLGVVVDRPASAAGAPPGVRA